MKHKVLVVTDVMEPGGVDTYTYKLAQFVENKNCEITIVVESKSESRISSLLSKSYNIHKCPLNYKLYPKEFLKVYFSYLILRFQPSLIHFSCGSIKSCLPQREIALDRKIPFFITEHFVSSNVQITPEQFFYIKKSYVYARAIFVVEESMVFELSKILPAYCLGRIKISPNGIMLADYKESFSRKQRKERLRLKILNNVPIRAISAGRFCKQKGFDVLLNALDDNTNSPNSSFKLDLYGEGSEVDNYKDIIRSRNLKNIVTINPWIDNLIEVLNDSDLFIFPSREEGLSLLLLEALASHIPIIASNITSSFKACGNGRFASFFNHGSSNSLRENLDNWICRANNKINSLYQNRSNWLYEKYNQNRSFNELFNSWNSISIIN